MLRGQPEAWAAYRRDPRPLEVVMKEHAVRLKWLPHRPGFVTYPARLGLTFVYRCLIRFAGESPYVDALVRQAAAGPQCLRKR